MEEDEEFIYLALERCRESLADLMKNSLHTNSYFVTRDGRPTSMCLQVFPFQMLHDATFFIASSLHDPRFQHCHMHTINVGALNDRQVQETCVKLGSFPW